MLRPGTLFWKLFLGTTVLIVAVLGTCAWLIVREVERFHAAELDERLYAQALLARLAVEELFDPPRRAELRRFAESVGTPQESGVRLTLILPDGTVAGDSEANADQTEPHGTRPEVREAMAGRVGRDTRHSRTVGYPMAYLALPVGPAESPVGVVRVAVPYRTITARRDAVERLVWTITLLGLLAAAVFAVGLARLWSRPIRRITTIARSLSRGDLSARARVSGGDELAMLGQSLNEMRDHLAAQLGTIDRQRRTLQSLITQIREGVVAAGPDGRIVLTNPAAERLLGLEPPAGRGTNRWDGLAVEECITHHALQRMLLPGAKGRPGEVPGADANGESDGHVEETRLQTGGAEGGVSLLARASDIVLPAASGAGDRRATAGRLLVLTDITELTRLMQVKADFAANASHELRTPLSAIRAAVETLMGLDLADDAQSARQFMEVIERHSARLEAMVADLLDLSRIESASGRFDTTTLDVEKFVDDLHARFDAAVREKGLVWRMSVEVAEGGLRANPYLLALVLDNLVDNAIKFTDRGGSVEVSFREGRTEGGAGVVIEVKDEGCGIPEEEQERVFERFYQVERARSGRVRGTGLGLSIVRHAVAAMNGGVTLQSAPGAGTRVTVHLPGN